MKSYFLDTVNDAAYARKLLSDQLPTQTDPWVLQTPDGSDVIAYFNIELERNYELEGPHVIQADMSGRHYNEDKAVVTILKALQASLGGTIRDDQ